MVGPYHIVKANVVLEGKCCGEAGRDCEVLAGNDLEKLQRVLGLLLLLLEESFGYQDEPSYVSFSFLNANCEQGAQLGALPFRCCR